MSVDDLAALSRDLWWTTQPEAHALWPDLHPALWTACKKSPVAMMRALDLESLGPELEQRVADLVDRWPRGARPSDPPTDKKIAYMCMEFGLHTGLPIYSGGLGMLAGDHLRSASDLGLDMVAVGLLYRQGYFIQTIQDGQQVATYPRVDPDQLGLLPVRGSDGARLIIEVPDGESSILAQAWEVRIGGVRLFLLDTDLEENPAPVRALTERLYGGDDRVRLHQEVLLGFGGKHLLDALGIRPDVFHINEGHAAFVVLALVAEAHARGTGVDEAWAEARGRCVFTTHTPIPAGHDRFAPEAVQQALGPALRSAGLADEDWMDRSLHGDEFCMSTLAIHGSRAVNGVSRLHAEIATGMFAHLNLRVQPITNGVHPTAWMAHETASFLDMHLPGWRSHISDPEFWTAAAHLPTDGLLALRAVLRGRLVDAVQEALGADVLDPNKLTLGFARRFAGYKRAGLLFTQPERLAAILDRGVQVVFAGKAHPQDTEGQEMLAEVIRWSKEPRFAGRVVFVPGYDPDWGRLLTQGSDVWLNTPRRPREASGTSGQKAALNGNPNLSVLDGWWPEGWDGDNGWAIPGTGDVEDALALYTLLEDKVIPAFADPDAWARMMAHVLATCVPVFNTDRMLRDYCRLVYDPE
jgi:alpha-glucan phosphorylase-like protein